MKINNVRASTLNTYKDCEFKYWLIHQCEAEDQTGFKAILGTIIHWVAEILAKSKKNNHYKLNSKINDFNILLKIAYSRFRKDYPHHQWNEEIDIAFCKKQIEYIINSPFNPLKCNILDIEKQFEISLNKIGFALPGGEYLKLRGTMDRIDLIDQDTIHIIDYKSGKRLNWDTGTSKELEHFEKDIQFRIYNLAASIIYPKYKYRIFTVLYPQDGGPYSFSIDDSDKPKILDIIRRDYNNIYLNDKPSRLIDDNLRKREHFKCRYVCSFGKNGLCDKYFNLLKKERFAKATEKIQQISISMKRVKISARNDYSNNKIVKINLIGKDNDSPI